MKKGLAIGIVLFLVIILSAFICLAADEAKPALSDLLGLIKNYDDRRDGLPLADWNKDQVGGGAKDKRKVYSESVSYIMLSSVLLANDENQDEMKERFYQSWDWAKSNMVRKNVEQVFNWETKKWENMPDDLKDNLLAWRYIQGINNEERSGIIYQKDKLADDKCTTWHDGSQTASDGDLLTAYSLYLAYKRGWGDQLLDDAINMVRDIRQKEILNFKAGELYNAAFLKKPGNLYPDIIYKKNEEALHSQCSIDLLDTDNAFGWKGKYNYVGFYSNAPFFNLSSLDHIEIEMKGSIGANAALDIRLQDTKEVPGDDQQPGHVWRTFPQKLTGQFSVFSFYPDDFSKNKDYGTQDGTIDWTKIKNIQFQVDKINWYSQYKGTYGTGTQNVITNEPGNITWKGNNNVVVFTLTDVMDLSNVKSIKLLGEGSSEVPNVNNSLEFQVISDKDDNDRAIATLPLYDTMTSIDFTFTKDQFSPYANFNWSKVKKFLIQINNIESTVKLESIVITRNDGKEFTIKWLGEQDKLEESIVYIKSINVILKDGQTAANNGYKLLSNSHGAPYINPSYFMPFAYRVFSEIDPEGKDVWTALINATYEELDKSLGLTLLDLDKNEVKGNGMLVPNWYMFDSLTGKRKKVETQKESSDENPEPSCETQQPLKGYLFGYDAFRTVWYIAMDYFLNNEPKAKDFIEKISPFFRNKLDADSGFCDEYKIDGMTENNNCTEGNAAFAIVYANIFKVLSDPVREKKAIALGMAKKKTGDNGRVWFDNNCDNNGEDEYYLNHWAFFGLFSDIHYNDPRPRITANGAYSSVTAPTSTPVRIDVSLVPGKDMDQNADWWLIYYNHSSEIPSSEIYYSFVYPSAKWVPGIVNTVQSPLVEVPFINVFSEIMPSGRYTFHFGVRRIRDKEVEEFPLFYDSVEVTVQ